MLRSLQHFVRRVLALIERPLAKTFSSANNPIRHLGSLTIFFCWIVLISGIWLLIFFRTSVNGAFESVSYLTYEQWLVGGVMRSLHRYASDGAIVTLFIHIVYEFSHDTYRLRRWFTWVAGIPLVWMLFLLGITGYWLVWDELAQYVALTSSELLDAIPIFTDKMAANFLTDVALSDRFFTLMAFFHLIGLPIFLVFGIWLHVFRLTRPRVNPPRALMAGTLFTMLVLSLIFPAPLQDKANLAVVPQTVQIDWFYLHAFPLVQSWSPGLVWALLVGITALMAIAPWLPPGKTPDPARVDLDNCNGCHRCMDDCPYGAINMLPRSDGSRYDHEAVVDPDLCVSCGICVGSCPTATPFRRRSALIPGIDLPNLTARKLKEAIDDLTVDRPPALAFACSDSDALTWYRNQGNPCVEVKCLGQIPPSYFDYILSRDLCGQVLLDGCGDNCQFRFGNDWTEQRINRTRDPQLRRRVSAERIVMAGKEGGSHRATLYGRLRQDADTEGVEE